MRDLGIRDCRHGVPFVGREGRWGKKDKRKKEKERKRERRKEKKEKRKEGKKKKERKEKKRKEKRREEVRRGKKKKIDRTSPHSTGLCLLLGPLLKIRNQLITRPIAISCVLQAISN